MIKAVIFDLDGVIVSTDNLHYLAWKMIADNEGIYFDEKINHRLRGVSRTDSLEIILEKANKKYSIEEKQELAFNKNEYYKKLLDTISPVDILPGIIDTISFFKEKNIKIAIGSASKNAKLILKKIGLLNSFDVIVDGTYELKSKPNSDIFIKAAKLLQIPNHECLVIEDSQAGIDAARKANMKTIGIGNLKNTSVNINSFKERNIQELLIELDR